MQITSGQVPLLLHKVHQIQAKDLSHYNREYVLISKWASGHSESWHPPWYEVKDLAQLPQGLTLYTVQQADLYHNAGLIVNYLFTVLKRTPEQLSYTLGYMDVYVPRVQRQKVPLKGIICTQVALYLYRWNHYSIKVESYLEHGLNVT